MPPVTNEDAALRAALAIARDQARVITRAQAIERGMSPDAVRWRLDTGQWSYVFAVTRSGSRPGVYATVSGRLDREARLWAAILACGQDATLSHETAAELHGLIDLRRDNGLVHVTVPSNRNIRPPLGIRVHYSNRLEQSRHPALEPPRTRVDDTVVDLCQAAPNIDRASALIGDAVQRRLTTHGRIAENIAQRPKLRWRAELLEICGVIGSGAHTLLELRYVKGVERAHGLPRAQRQLRLNGPATERPPGSNGLRIVDNKYVDHQVIVELDGQRGHTGDGVFRDMWRDNLALVHGDRTLRFGFDDVDLRRCETAATVAAVLGVEPNRCGQGCRVLDVWQALMNS